MLFVFALVCALAFFLAFQPWITKRPSIFYALTALLLAALFGSYFTGSTNRFPNRYHDFD